MDSSKGWTLQRAQGAIEAAFLFRESLEPAAPDGFRLAQLRFTEIRDIINSRERKIGDRTLARAIDNLLKRGELIRETEGKTILYSLAYPEAGWIRAYARMDSASIERSGELGGVYNVTEGWAVYGIPGHLSREADKMLVGEVRRHKKELDHIVVIEWDKFVDSILTPAKKRLSSEVVDRGRDALSSLTTVNIREALDLAFAIRLWKAIEMGIPTPGSGSKGVMYDWIASSPFSERIPIAFAKIGGAVATKKDQAELEKRLDRARRLGLAIKPLWDVLTPKEQEKASEGWLCATTMTARMTSVIHV